MGDGLDLNLPMTLGCLWAIFCTDLVQDLEYQVRPYEVRAGPDRRGGARRAWSYLYEVFRNRPQHGDRGSRSSGTSPRRTSCGPCARSTGSSPTIEVDRLRVKPTVKITGEFYLQTVEGDPNYNIHRWLEAEGARGLPGGHHRLDGLPAAAGAAALRGLQRHRAAAPGSSSALGPRGPGHLPLDVQPPAPRDGRPAARAARASSSCAGSPRPTSTAASTAARATCWSARRSGRTRRRRPT